MTFFKMAFKHIFFPSLREIERHGVLPSDASISKHLQELGLGYMEARSQELNQVLPRGWRPKSLTHTLLPSRMYNSRKLEWRVELGLKSGHSSMGYGSANQCLNCCAICLPHGAQNCFHIKMSMSYFIFHKLSEVPSYMHFHKIISYREEQTK